AGHHRDSGRRRPVTHSERRFMAWNNRVVWSEGMFLRPQHLQQHDRYVETLVDSRCRPLLAGGWGFSELQLDTALLTQGKLAILSARGVLPDGTPFDIPG